MVGQLIGRMLGLPAYRDKTTALVVTAQQTIYRAIIVLLTVTAILWMAVFLYVAFYYSYMPAISHTRPVHLQYSSCGREKGLCTFPTANVTLTRRQQLLMVGQPYRILVELDMPESQRNQEVGMFLVCLQLRDVERVVLDKSCRSAMLHYKSPLLQTIITTMLAPFLISGSAEEKQLVSVELFSGFEEDPLRPVTEAEVQIQSQHVEVYKVYLRIHAHFTGLRYFMFHWPVLSASVGIITNLFFLSVIAFLSWYKFFTPKQVVVHVGYDSSAAKTLEERRALAKERLMRERSRLVSQKSDEKKEDVEAIKDKQEESPEKPTSPPDSSTSPPEVDSTEVKDDDKDKEAKHESPKGSGSESRKTSDEYEVIPGGQPKTNGDDDAIDDDDFTELYPDSTATTKSSNSKEGSDDNEEEDKENNLPTPSEEDNEVRQRRGKVKTADEEEEKVSHN